MENLNSIAVLASLNATAFTGSVADKAVTEEVTEAHSTERDVFKVRKALFPASTCGSKNAFTAIRKFIGQTREQHYAASLPFEDGWQLLPLVGQPQHDGALLRAEERMRDEFIPALRDAYPELVEGARRAHNGTFDPALYPSVDKFCEAFSLSHSYRPVPSGAALANKVFNARMQSIREQLERDNEAKVANAVSETWRRLTEPMVELAQRLVDPEQRRLKHIVENVREIAERVPLLNLTGDVNLARAGARITEILAGVSAEALHDNPALRTEKACQIVELARTFGKMGERKLAA